TARPRINRVLPAGNPASRNARRAARWNSGSMSMDVSTPPSPRPAMPRSRYRPLTPAPVPSSTTAFAPTVVARNRSAAPVDGAAAQLGRPGPGGGHHVVLRKVAVDSLGGTGHSCRLAPSPGTPVKARRKAHLGRIRLLRLLSADSHQSRNDNGHSERHRENRGGGVRRARSGNYLTGGNRNGSTGVVPSDKPDGGASTADRK